MQRRRSRRREENRRLFFVGLFKLALVLGAFGLSAYYAYEAGFRVAQAQVGSLRQDLQRAVASAEAEKGQVQAEQTALAESKKQADDFKSLYEQAKPTDDMKELTDLMRAKLAGGMQARRLAFVIRSARNPHDCEMLGSRRFLVRTPRYRGPAAQTSVRFDELVTISADGAGANGGHEQWFDPERPVKVRVAASGTKVTELTGTLPIEHAIAVRNSEYHFTMSAANARGWVEVNTERCNFR